MIAIYLVIVLLSLLALHVKIQFNKTRRLINKIPGPTTLPFLGNALMFNVSAEQMWNNVLQIVNEFYPIVRSYIGTINIVFIRHPEDMKVLLSCKKNINKSNLVYSFFKSIDNDGLVMSGGDKWRQRRKMLNTAFNPNLLKIYTEIANEHTEQLIRSMINQNIETHVIPDLVDLTSKLSLAIICEATMGTDLNSFDNETVEKCRHCFDVIGDMALYRSARPYLKDWMMKFLSVGRRQESALKRGREFINKLIWNRRAYHQKVGYRKFQNVVDNVEEVTSANDIKRLAVLDLLLTAEKENLIDEKGLKEEVETIIVAGYETSGTAMAFVLLLLAENKTAQEIARDEVTKLLRETNGVLTIADINKLDYLDRCIKETLRLYPTGPIIGRRITEDIKLRTYTIPQKTEAMMHFFSLHRDPNFWPDPKKFDPDRFLPQNSVDRHPFAYLPFSAGPRTCIGYKFALLEVKLLVARVLYDFFIEPVDSIANVRFMMQMTLKPTDPCSVKLIKINRES